MATWSLRKAAVRIHSRKKTTCRANKADGHSTSRDDGRSFATDPAELVEAYSANVDSTGPEAPETWAARRDAPVVEMSDAAALRIGNAPRDISDMEKQRAAGEVARAEDLKAERDRWAVALEVSQRQITSLTDKAEALGKSQGWPQFRRAG
jgi:hypothetical protein